MVVFWVQFGSVSFSLFCLVELIPDGNGKFIKLMHCVTALTLQPPEPAVSMGKMNIVCWLILKGPPQPLGLGIICKFQWQRCSSIWKHPRVCLGLSAALDESNTSGTCPRQVRLAPAPGIQFAWSRRARFFTLSSGELPLGVCKPRKRLTCRTGLRPKGAPGFPSLRVDKMSRGFGRFSLHLDLGTRRC